MKRQAGLEAVAADLDESKKRRNSSPGKVKAHRDFNKIQSVFNGKCERILLIQPPHFPEELLDVKIAKNKISKNISIFN